jgi:hypothetical protein
MKTIVWIALVGCLVLGCGSPERAETTSEPASSGSEGNASATTAVATAARVRSNARPPTLSEEMVASDSANPALTVSPETGWVVIPSFRLGIAMPDGWYWSDAEEMLRATEATRHHFDDASIENLRRGLQAVVNEFVQGDPSMAGRLMPSARVLLLPGGLPRGAHVGAEFCTQSVLPELTAVYPDAAMVSQAALTVAGYPAVRCGVDHSVEMVAGVVLPGHSESVLVFGESHVIMLAVVGGADRASRTAEILSAMVTSVQAL